MSSYPKLKNICSLDPETAKKVFPVSAVINHGNGVFRVERDCKIQDIRIDTNGRKGRKIKMLTRKSLALLTATIQATDIELKTMLTLTYPEIYPRNGAEVKQGLGRILANLRNKGAFEYVWFLEFQVRGAPHVHLLTDHNGISPKMRVDMAYWWVGHIKDSDWFQDQAIMESIKCGDCEYKKLASHLRKAFNVACHPHTWQWVREREGAKRYITAYAAKPEQKEVPKNYRDVGRFWGCSRGIKLGKGKIIKTTEVELKEFLSQQDHPAAKFDMIPKYLWNVQNT